VLIGGDFTSVDGTSRNSIARLNADGSLDTSFDPRFGATSFVRSVAVQSDGKVLIGGQFTTNGTSIDRIARLNNPSLTPVVVTPSEPIPTMSQWGLLIFGLIILNLSVFYVQRRALI
ncbi:MAG: delta-60 repeat domain-containing protein, partial [Bacteroidota bacterium]